MNHTYNMREASGKFARWYADREAGDSPGSKVDALTELTCLLDRLHTTDYSPEIRKDVNRISCLMIDWIMECTRFATSARIGYNILNDYASEVRYTSACDDLSDAIKLNADLRKQLIGLYGKENYERSSEFISAYFEKFQKALADSPEYLGGEE